MLRHFSQIHRRAIDEVWYKRAVDHYEIEPESFVYSIPFNTGNKNYKLNFLKLLHTRNRCNRCLETFVGGGNLNPQIIATHAIFVENQGYKAPVAVVGIQFQYKTLAAHFLNITSTVRFIFSI